MDFINLYCLPSPASVPLRAAPSLGTAPSSSASSIVTPTRPKKSDSTACNSVVSTPMQDDPSTSSALDSFVFGRLDNPSNCKVAETSTRATKRPRDEEVVLVFKMEWVFTQPPCVEGSKENIVIYQGDQYTDQVTLRDLQPLSSWHNMLSDVILASMVQRIWAANLSSRTALVATWFYPKLMFGPTGGKPGLFSFEGVKAAIFGKQTRTGNVKKVWGQCDQALVMMYTRCHYFLVELVFSKKLIQVYCSLNDRYPVILEHMRRYCSAVVWHYGQIVTTWMEWSVEYVVCQQQRFNNCGVHTILNTISIMSRTKLLDIRDEETSHKFRCAIYRSVVDNSIEEPLEMMSEAVGSLLVLQ